MNNRYTERHRLPPRQYVVSSPVVLLAGALLEDTQIPRLVVQLKFKNISPKTISALRVTIDCFGAEGAPSQCVTFSYQDLRVHRGQSFGQYTAIALPNCGADCFAARVTAVRFTDGTRWLVDEKAVQESLPAFAQEGTAFAQATHADLWYCRCGGVNRDREVRCHRCGKRQETALTQARKAVESAQRTEQAAPLAQAPLAAPVPFSAAESLSPTEGMAPRKQKRHRFRLSGKRLVLVAACAALLATVLVLPKMIRGNEAKGDAPMQAPQPLPSSAPAKPSTQIHVTTPSNAESFSLDLQADENGDCSVTKELLLEHFPQMSAFEFSGVPHMGNDIDPYLANSFHMAQLVASGAVVGANTPIDSSFSAQKDAKSNRCLLIFSDLTTLSGYAISPPEERGSGVWRLSITRCDYDFGSLYLQQAEAYSKASQPPYLLPENLKDSGAKSFLYSFSMPSNDKASHAAQLYHLWNQATSPYVERHLRNISTWDDRAPTGSRDQPTWREYYLFDENRKLIGYTTRTTGDRITGPLCVKDARIYTSQTQVSVRLTALLTGDLPAASDFSVTVNGTKNPVVDVQQSHWWQLESDKRTRLLLNLQSPILPGEANIRVSYQQSSSALESFDDIAVVNELNLVWVENQTVLTNWEWDSKSMNKDAFDISLSGQVLAEKTLRVSNGSTITVTSGKMLTGQSASSKILVEGSGKVVFPDNGVTLTRGSYHWSEAYGWISA